jgi:uncharacterized protein HemX
MTVRLVRCTSWSRFVAAVAAVLLFTVGPNSGPALAQDAAEGSATTTTTTVEHERAEAKRGSNPGGAVAGFGLLAAWLVIGYAQFRRGRRRLAAGGRTEDRNRGQHETTRPEPQASADVAAGSRLADENEEGHGSPET